jgi:hypothetical protein
LLNKDKKKPRTFKVQGLLIGFVFIYQPLASEPKHNPPVPPLGVVGLSVFKFKVFMYSINIDKGIKKSILNTTDV